MSLQSFEICMPLGDFVVWILGKNKKSSTVFPIFYILGVTKITLTIFFEGIDWAIFFVLLQW